MPVVKLSRHIVPPLQPNYVSNWVTDGPPSEASAVNNVFLCAGLIADQTSVDFRDQILTASLRSPSSMPDVTNLHRQIKGPSCQSMKWSDLLQWRHRTDQWGDYITLTTTGGHQGSSVWPNQFFLKWGFNGQLMVEKSFSLQSGALCHCCSAQVNVAYGNIVWWASVGTLWCSNWWAGEVFVGCGFESSTESSQLFPLVSISVLIFLRAQRTKRCII